MTELLVFFSWRVLNVLEKKKESSTQSILLRQQITCYTKTSENKTSELFFENVSLLETH